MNNDNTLIKSVARVMSPSGDMLGTAFIASPAGHLLTCWHVIEGFDSIKIILEDHKEPINATILKELSNPNEDIAVLQITPRKLKIVPLGIDWEPGDEVWTYGYQLQDVTTVGFPILSNILLDREVENGNQIIEISGTNFTKGFSGAPLLHKESGRIIGIVNARLSRNGVGSAIPIKTVSQSWPEINDQIQKDKQQAIDDVISLFQTLGYSIEKQK
jgi:S1-C subfamily serine protease